MEPIKLFPGTKAFRYTDKNYIVGIYKEYNSKPNFIITIIDKHFKKLYKGEIEDGEIVIDNSSMVIPYFSGPLNKQVTRRIRQLVIPTHYWEYNKSSKFYYNINLEKEVVTRIAKNSITWSAKIFRDKDFKLYVKAEFIKGAMRAYISDMKVIEIIDK